MTKLDLTILVLTGVILLNGSKAVSATPAVKTTTPVATAQNNKADWQTKWNQALANARKEGKVMIYTSQSGDLIRGLAKVFKQKYGIDVEFTSGRAEELTQKIQTESHAGLYLADIMLAGPGILITEMKPVRTLDKLPPLMILPDVMDPKSWVTGNIPYMDSDGTGVGMAAAVEHYVLRNTDLVKDGEITSYKDLLNPKWKGKMVLDDPTLTGTGNAFFSFLATDLWGTDQTKRYLHQLAAQGPAITRDKRIHGEWVARGKYSLGIATDRATATNFIRAGAPVQFIRISEGTRIGSGGGGLGVLARRPHPNATTIFVNWILSKDGMATYVKLSGRPGARVDAPREGVPPDLFPEPGEKIFLETEQSLAYRNEMIKVATEIFGPQMK